MKTAPITEAFGTTILGSSDSDIFELDKTAIVDLFKSSSLLLFRGFDVDSDRFKTFTELFSTNFVSYVGGAYSREMIKGDKTLLSVTGGKQTFAVPLHGEMYYRKHKPEIIWFYCATPPLRDGETTICDGMQIYKNLSDSTQKLFTTKQIKYIRTYPAEGWQKIYHTDDLSLVEKICQDNNMQLEVNPDKSITTKYITSAIIEGRSGNYKIFINNILPVIEQELKGSNSSIVRFEDDSKIPDAIIKEIKTISDNLTYAVSWETGDILMVDNTRLLHGRNSFSDNQRDIYVRLCEASFNN